jgi:hypothetical protein
MVRMDSRLSTPALALCTPAVALCASAVAGAGNNNDNNRPAPRRANDTPTTP